LAETLYLRALQRFCSGIAPNENAICNTSVDRIRELAGSLPDGEIANQLNGEGRLSAKGQPYTVKIIQWIRCRYRIPPAELKMPEEFTVQQVASRFGTSVATENQDWGYRRTRRARGLPERRPDRFSGLPMDSVTQSDQAGSELLVEHFR
jgi:hypothetical protein